MNEIYLYAIFGGLLIGIAAIAMLGLLGKITGISGVLWQAVSNKNSFHLLRDAWRWFFLLGLILGPIIVHNVFAWPEPKASEAGPLVAILAGLLVGFGTKLGSGCTSGHGICGIGRLSKRSIVATISFMVSAMITLFVVNKILDLLSVMI